MQWPIEDAVLIGVEDEEVEERVKLLKSSPKRFFGSHVIPDGLGFIP